MNKTPLVALIAPQAETLSSKATIDLITMDAKTIDSHEKIYFSQETTDLIERWRNIVKWALPIIKLKVE